MKRNALLFVVALLGACVFEMQAAPTPEVSESTNWLDRSAWEVQASTTKIPAELGVTYEYVTDGSTGKPSDMFDNSAATHFSLVKPGKSEGGEATPEGFPLFFVVDTKTAQKFDIIKWNHREDTSGAIYNEGANLRKVSVYGSNSAGTLDDVVAEVLADKSAEQLYSDFFNPSIDKKPMPLWFWNAGIENITVEKIREIVKKSYEESSYGGFGILPALNGGYLSEQYFTLYEAALDEGRKYGMKFILYDENWFPSFTAGGLLAKKYPELTAKVLKKYEQSGSGGETLRVLIPENGAFMGAVAMNTATLERRDITDMAVIKDSGTFDPAKEPYGTTASSFFGAGYEADKAVDGNMATRWNSAANSYSNQYLQIKYREPKTFNKVKVYEDSNPVLHRVTVHKIQYYDYNTQQWETATNGTRITNVGVVHEFDAVSSDLVRLFVDEIENGDSFTINEFQVYLDETKIDPPAYIPSGLRPLGYSASSFFDAAYNADKAFDGNMDTRWNAALNSVAPQWLEMGFGRDRTVTKAVLYEDASTKQIQTYEIQYWNGVQWMTCASGSNPNGTRVDHVFDAPVTASGMRLNITAVKTNLPSVSELEFYDGDKKLSTADTDIEPEGSYLDYLAPGTAGDTWKIIVYMCEKNGGPGVDYLSEEAVAGYIDVTHEAYYAHFKEYFDDGTFVMAFYDEPGFEGTSNQPWTPAFNEAYKQFFPDNNPVLDYPALFGDIGAATIEARDRLYYVRTELFAKNYIGQMSAWCDAHGIEQTGHMFEEESNPLPFHGDLMKSFKYVSIPGVDVIFSYGAGRQAFKVVSSAAYNWDKGRVMCEAFGGYGATVSIPTLYKTLMDLGTTGINLIVPHAIWYNDQSVTYPPELSYRDATFGPALPAMNAYISRLHTMLQNGRHVADIAVMYPIDYLESDYMYGQGRKGLPADADFMRIGETLSLTARRDFTYLHPDVIDEKITIDGASMLLNNDTNWEEYKVFIVPGTRVISLSNMRKIKQFYDGGGKVIFTTQLPLNATRTADTPEVLEIMNEMFGFETGGGDSGEKLYSSSSDYSASYNAAKAFDGVSADNSRWSAYINGAGQWLQVEFPATQSIDRVVIKERFSRLTGYNIEYLDGSEWKTCATGTMAVAAVGGVKTEEKTFAPVTTIKLRLYATGMPTDQALSIDEFEVYYGTSGNLALNTSTPIGGNPYNSNAAGGEVYYLKNNPQNDLTQTLDNVLSVYDVKIGNVSALSGGHLSYIHKVLDNKHIYFFANSSNNAVNTTVTLRGALEKPMLWNPVDGTKKDAEYEITTIDGQTVTNVTLKLTAVESVFIVETPDESLGMGQLEVIARNADITNNPGLIYYNGEGTFRYIAFVYEDWSKMSSNTIQVAELNIGTVQQTSTGGLKPALNNFSIYPTIVTANQPFEVNMGSLSAAGNVHVYTTLGVKVSETVLAAGSNSISAPSQAGLYLVKAKLGAEEKTLWLIVK